jgi:hypothetical protein
MLFEPALFGAFESTVSKIFGAEKHEVNMSVREGAAQTRLAAGNNV